MKHRSEFHVPSKPDIPQNPETHLLTIGSCSCNLLRWLKKKPLLLFGLGFSRRRKPFSLRHFLYIMFFLKYSTYLISILSITGVLSSPQIQDSIKSDVRLRRERDFNSLSTNQGNSISFQPDSSTPSDQSLNEITIKLQQAGTLPPDSELNSISNTLLEPEFSPPPQDSALVPFDENGGLTNIIPSFPQLNLFPQSDTPDPNIPPDTHTDSPTERKEPDCQYGKFAFCCQQGPPARGTNKKGLSPAVLRERERERTSRLGKCRKCEYRLSNLAPLPLESFFT